MLSDTNRRPIKAHYSDPLDLIWTETAARLGLTIARSKDSYASYDGAGGLSVSDEAGFDADDSLAQLIFHELCHLLVEGEAARHQVDWGLNNIDPSPEDLQHEYACLRLQRALLLPYGLEECLPATTIYRSYYDALGKRPLDSRRSAERALLRRSRAGHRRAQAAPYVQPLAVALGTTAQIASQASTLARDSLWKRYRPVPLSPVPRHPMGFPWGPADATCDDCAWARPNAAGRRRCVRSATGRGHGRYLNPDQLACSFFEAPLDCGLCGACCREAFDLIEVGQREPLARNRPELLSPGSRGLELRRVGGRCPLLVDAGGSYLCGDYAGRPRSCADFEQGSRNCLIARQRVGISAS